MPLPTVWGFLLLCVTQGSGENWQKPASLVVPTPALHPISVRRQSRQRLSEFFLAAQRRTASAVKKKLPKGNPWEGFPLGSFGNRGARPLWHPELPGTDSVTNRACSRTFEYWVVGSTTNLQDPTRRKANFLWKFPCAGTSHSAMRPPPPSQPTRKDFCRAKMPCGGQVFQICCSAVKSSDFLHASRYLHARKRVLPKYVEDCPIGKAMQIWNSRDLKRAAALLFPKESRENPFEGFSLGNFFPAARHGASLRS